MNPSLNVGEAKSIIFTANSPKMPIHHEVTVFVVVVVFQKMADRGALQLCRDLGMHSAYWVPRDEILLS